MNTTEILALLHQYNDNGFAAIPVYKTLRGDTLSGKITRIKDWSRFSIKLPTEQEIDSWGLKDACGVALVCGSISNLCAIDIDTDSDFIAAKMQYSPVTVKGKKGEKRLFRGRDLEDPSSIYPSGTVFPGKQVEVFISAKYVVVAGYHSPGIKYRSTGQIAIEGFDPLQLPVMRPDTIEIARNLQSINDPIAPVTTDQGIGRFSVMASRAGLLAARKTPFEDAVQELIDFDQTENKFNLFFNDLKWHKTKSPRINAIAYYSKHLESFAAGKNPKQIEEPEPTVISVIVEGQEWKTPLPINFEQIIPQMDIDLIPESLKHWVTWQQENLGVDLAPVYNKAETAISGLIGNKIVLQPKENDTNWREAANLWTMFIAAPGRKKIPYHKFCTGTP